jgi:adenylylsulfate kinase
MKIINKRFTLWLMGPTSSGKTTIAEKLLEKLREKGIQVIHYDGDEIRGFFGSDHGFEKKDRLKVVKTIVHLSNKAIEAGLNVIVSALTANEDGRKYIKEHVKSMIVVSVKCSIDECIKRDPKELYKKAIEGQISTLIGYNTEYKFPEDADIIIDTEKEDIENCIQKIIFELCSMGFDL